MREYRAVFACGTDYVLDRRLGPSLYSSAMQAERVARECVKAHQRLDCCDATWRVEVREVGVWEPWELRMEVEA